MEVFVQQLINGITLGSIYGLIAIGYTMVFGIIGMVNFAHGDVFMVSAFVALIALLILTTWLGIGSVALALLIVLIVAMVFTSLLNWVIERVAYRPLRALPFSPRAADLGDRHVDLSVKFRAGDAGSAQQAGRPDAPRRDRPDGARRLRRDRVLQTAHHLGHHGGPAGNLLVPCLEDLAGARAAPASRTRRWRRWSASMSTAPSR